MNYSGIKHYDIANGPGVGLSLFVSGCRHHCPSCFNQATWDFNNGERYTKETEESIVQFYKDNPEVKTFSLLGGEPFQQGSDMKLLFDLVIRLKNETQCNTFWVWSGSTFEELIKSKENTKLLSLFDVLIDGPFVESKKDFRLFWRGSTNQRLIDVNKSLEIGKTVELKKIPGYESINFI